MGKASLIIIFLIFTHQLNVKAQNTGGSKNNTITKNAGPEDRKPLREYTRYDTIFAGYRKRVTGYKLKYHKPVRDTGGITYLITEKTEEVIKLENGAWKIWNKGIEETPVFLHANSKGNVFVVASGKGAGWKLYQLKDTVWKKISENFATWPLTAGADGEFYCLKESKDANNIKYKTIHIWKGNAWMPIEGNNAPQLFYEESIKLYIPTNGTIFAVVRQGTKEQESLVIHQWKNKEWKKIGEFNDKYISLSTQGTDKLNRFFVTYYNFKDEQIGLRRWDGNTWAAAMLPQSPTNYFSISNNLTGELFCKVNFPKPQEDYQLNEEKWVKLNAEPNHIIPKYDKEVFPQIDGHYYETEYGILYDLGTQFTVRKRNFKEYPFVISPSMEKILPANIKEHLSLFRLLEDNGKFGLASRSNDYEIIHTVFDSIRVEKNYISENEYKEQGYTEYQPFVLALYTGGKSMDVNILAIKWRPYKSDQILEGTITTINTCRKCNGTGKITAKSVNGYTREKNETIKIKDRYRSASGDLVEKTYSFTERTPSETIYEIKEGPCNCGDGKIENTIRYFFDIEKQAYRD